jgi:beta-lactamase superfamily II metal-dependent hydrolase
MALALSFLAVGNADCVIAIPDSREAIVVDIGDAVRAEQHLRAAGVSVISVVYITHEHADHAPSLEKLDAFLVRWLALPGSIRRIRVPRGLGHLWKVRIEGLEARGEIMKAARLRGALQRLTILDMKKAPAVLDTGRAEDPHRDGDLVVEVLHPSYLFLETQEGHDPRPNEASMVVRLTYGRFAAMLLGDLDGRGIEECVLLANHSPDVVKGHLVKIPHHGAWPRSDRAAQALAALLAAIHPEIAILSVGSTNTYGHVTPELFSCLLALKQQIGLRFICTEVTQTCLLPEAQRDGRGLPLQRCAGDITVTAEVTGQWTHATADADHAARVRSIPYAACDGRAMLPLAPRRR